MMIVFLELLGFGLVSLVVMVLLLFAEAQPPWWFVAGMMTLSFFI